MEQFLNYVNEVFDEIGFFKTSQVLREEMKKQYIKDIEGGDSFHSNQRISFQSPRSSFSENNKSYSKSMLIQNNPIQRKKKFQSYREQNFNPFLERNMKTPIMPPAERIPNFSQDEKSEKTKKIFSKNDNQNDENSQNEQNFSFGEDSNSANINKSQENKTLEQNILNTSFGNVDNDIEDDVEDKQKNVLNMSFENFEKSELMHKGSFGEGFGAEDDVQEQQFQEKISEFIPYREQSRFLKSFLNI